MRVPYQPASVLAKHMAAYLSNQRALGKRMLTEEKSLRLLDRYVVDQLIGSLSDITPQVIDAFLIGRPRGTARSYNALLTPLSRFFRWLVIQDILAASPVLAESRRSGQVLRPFLFGSNDAQRLFAAAADLPSRSNAPERGRIYRMIFILLYGLGMRVGEVCRLQYQDVDLTRALLHVRKGKFSKDRLVPFGPNIDKELRQFMSWRAACSPMEPESSVFTFKKDARRPLYPYRVSMTFHRLVPQLSLCVPEGTRAPNLHCLRHSFAVGTLLRWYRSGIDPNSRLLHLSTFLGHVNPSATATYLTITDELLQAANKRFSRFAPTFVEVSP
jgi:site-specific recombinase XerD